MKLPNPCDNQRFAELWVWLATDCWCCSGFRAVLAIGMPALWIGTMLPDWPELKWFTAGLAIVGVVVTAYTAVTQDDEEAK